MSLIPSRNPNAVSGSQFAKNNLNISNSIREKNILNEFLSGNIPDFLRKFYKITISDGTNTLSYLTMNDVLSIGSNDDFIRMPMTPITAQAIADKYDCTLPTTKMVDDIWKQAEIKLEPKPWGPPYDSSMMSTARFRDHNEIINKQMVDKDQSKLVSGHKKDVVITNQLNLKEFKNNEAIYGWIQSNGKPIQQLNPKSHDINYSDYSNCVRLTANDVILNNKMARMQDIFSDPKLCHLVSDEGPVIFQKY